jgi:cytochrome c-type biogenesis protein CcmH/NrfG
MAIILLGVQVACTALPPSQGQAPAQASAQDLFEIERQAASAYENDDWQASEKHYLVLVEKDPEQAMHWLRLGNIYARTNRPDMAVMAYREAVVRDTELTNAWYNMGIIQLKQAAYSFNEMQLHVQPDDPVAAQGRRLLEGILGLIEGDSPPE